MKESNFAKAQESRRKDVERMFGMLQARWHTLTNPCRLWSKDAMKDVVVTCCILHNMILESEMSQCESLPPPPPEWIVESPVPMSAANPVAHADRLVGAFESIVDPSIHKRLQDDLMEHQWQIRLHNSM
ncbi:hypothetical protein AaE_016097 [Aphanomyces astaci]|uniref:DDE Tnp4 domain-containing protein n=1 Tax=Aphanomyces astaci TaxID=112090 RepID=A0A6A4Z024_APHAT|nr:hypothetical protein AaE_016097 [Aphanomyces astaci]